MIERGAGRKLCTEVNIIKMVDKQQDGKNTFTLRNTFALLALHCFLFPYLIIREMPSVTFYLTINQLFVEQGNILSHY